MAKLAAKENRVKELSIDILADVFGGLIFSIGVQSLSAPNNLPPGGVTAIAVIINYLTNLPISLLSLLINIPILILSWVMLGRKSSLNTIRTVVILTAMLELTNRFVPKYEQGDMMLSAIFAGVLQGIGLAIIFMRGSNTGGTDILSKVIQLYFPHISIGRFLLAIDAITLVITVFVYKSIANAMYALILVFVATQVIDSIIYGLDRGRMIMIISDKHDEICTAIDCELQRGSTLLYGQGAYTGTEKKVIMCAVSVTEFHNVKKLTYSIDPSAFVMSLETDEVLGEGFKPWEVGK